MAGSPAWKVYRSDGRYMAACKEAEAAAALVSFYGDGATVRHDHKHIVWLEGDPTARRGADGTASDSYDSAAGIMHARVDRTIRDRNARYAAQEGR